MHALKHGRNTGVIFTPEIIGNWIVYMVSFPSDMNREGRKTHTGARDGWSISDCSWHCWQLSRVNESRSGSPGHTVESVEKKEIEGRKEQKLASKRETGSIIKRIERRKEAKRRGTSR